MLNLLKSVSTLWERIIILMLRKYTPEYSGVTGHGVANVLTNAQKTDTACACEHASRKRQDETANGVKRSPQVKPGKGYLLFFVKILPVFLSVWDYFQTQAQTIYTLWFEIMFEGELDSGRGKREELLEKESPVDGKRGRPHGGGLPSHAPGPLLSLQPSSPANSLRGP